MAAYDPRRASLASRSEDLDAAPPAVGQAFERRRGGEVGADGGASFGVESGQGAVGVLGQDLDPGQVAVGEVRPGLELVVELVGPGDRRPSTTPRAPVFGKRRVVSRGRFVRRASTEPLPTR